ncbi:MAG: RidA family protein [Pseudomonadota bacterium]
MNKLINPPDIAGPFGNYSHACAAGANQRWLMVAGQVGVRPDATTAEGIEAQTEVALRNLVAILAADKMDIKDIVKMTTLIVDRDDLPGYRRGRDKVLGDHCPPNTLHVVVGLAKPEWLIEIEAFAAKPA